MAELTAQQANDLAHQFLALAQAIGDYRYRHWNDISKIQHRQLASQHSSVLHHAEDMLALSTVLIMSDVKVSLATIRKITTQIKSVLGTLGDIQKGVDLSASVVSLGAAILGLNPAAIAVEVNKIAEEVKGLVRGS